MQKQLVLFRDLDKMDYKTAWDLQETLLQQNVSVKSEARNGESLNDTEALADEYSHHDGKSTSTIHHLLFVEHPPVYTLGKSGKMENVIIGEEQRIKEGIDFFHTNRGGDITFHGPEQIVGYPIFDLEKFYTDIGRYLR